MRSKSGHVIEFFLFRHIPDYLKIQVDQLPGVPRYRDAISRILRDSFAKNLTARFELPKRPRKKHNPFPGTIADIYGPLLVVPGADEPGPLQEYSDSVISLYGLQPSRFEAYPLKNQSG
ncbi:unnamed protein product [Protopolystoma xenopodis]|uniref:Uncharacterized protein n=1 Tax=Protopolystoma xenopodis TaxID=117903 RepID=A0A3S5AKA7_9PLAT|nr:unnamed protein product [Protopolystoma xenopodis]